MAEYTLAFAGSGATTLDNTKDLLNDFLNFGPEDKEGFPEVPEDLDLHLLLPVSGSHVSEHLMTVFDWTEYADLPYSVVADEATVDKKRPTKDEKALLEYAEATEEVKTEAAVNTALIEALRLEKESGRDARLILLWGEEGDENSEILLDLAASHQIPVMDLTAGLDDLEFGEEEPNVSEEAAPEPEPEPEPVKEEKPRRGRRRSLEAEEKPLEDKPAPEPEEPKAEEKPKRTRRTPKTEDQVNAEETDEARRKVVEDAKSDEAEPAPHQTATRQDAEDVVVKALALKHEAKRAEVSADIRNRCGYHKATEDSAPLHTAIRKVTQDFMHILDGLLPEGREKALALTNAEQAMFWANAAVARSAGGDLVPEPITQGESSEAADEPKRGRGRPRKDGQPTRTRTPEEKATMEIWDEDKEEWVPKGRGRAPKDAKTRLVDADGNVVSE